MSAQKPPLAYATQRIRDRVMSLNLSVRDMARDAYQETVAAGLGRDVLRGELQAAWIGNTMQKQFMEAWDAEADATGEKEAAE